MSHLVIFDIDGVDQYEQFVAIDEAVALVERLRNEGNPSARIFRLEEIQFEVKAYFRVEVGASASPAVPVPVEPAYEVTPTEPEPATTELVVEPLPIEADELDDEPEGEPVEASSGPDDYAVSSSLGGARRGLFGR